MREWKFMAFYGVKDVDTVINSGVCELKVERVEGRLL